MKMKGCLSLLCFKEHLPYVYKMDKVENHCFDDYTVDYAQTSNALIENITKEAQAGAKQSNRLHFKLNFNKLDIHVNVRGKNCYEVTF